MFIQRQQTGILRCTLRFKFGGAYLKLDPKNTIRHEANFICFILWKCFFGITPQNLIHSAKTKSECAEQYSSLLPLDKHLTCLCLKLSLLNQSCNFDVLLAFKFLKPYLPTLFYAQKKEKPLPVSRNWHLLLGKYRHTYGHCKVLHDAHLLLPRHTPDC